MNKILGSPFVGEDSPLHPEHRAVIRAICEREAALPWSIPAGDEPLDERRMKRVRFTYEELLEQPDKVAETLREEREAIREAAKHLCKRPIKRVYLTGCGDSMAVMQGVRCFLEEVLEVTCEDMQALDFAYYDNRNVDKDTLVIMLSSSGETMRTLECMYVAQARGAQTLTLSNTPGSTMMRESTRGLVIHAARKGWPTQSSTAAMAMLVQLGIDMARERGFDEKRLDAFQGELDAMPELMRQVTAGCEEEVKRWAAHLADKSIYLFVGGGPSYSCAFFGAAKIKEATPNYAILVPLEEFHHYNSLKAGDPAIVIAPKGNSVPRAYETLISARNMGGEGYLVTTEGQEVLASEAAGTIFLPEITEFFSGLIYSIPVQMFGYYVAMEKYNRALAEEEKQ